MLVLYLLEEITKSLVRVPGKTYVCNFVSGRVGYIIPPQTFMVSLRFHITLILQAFHNWKWNKILNDAFGAKKETLCALVIFCSCDWKSDTFDELKTHPLSYHGS